MDMQAAAANGVQVLERAPGHLVVSGALVFETARKARAAGLPFITAAQSGSQLEVDCAQVNESDSAGLAVLLDWLAQGDKRGAQLRFVNLPAGIRAAAAISEVESMLGATT
jgi:phospholipid transport system transporter-binding protein